MPDEARGFAAIDESSRRELARKGGQAAHRRRTAHEWTREEAREAGRKGGGVLLRSGDDGQKSRVREAAAALGDIADTLGQIADDPGAASTDLIRAMRASIAQASDAIDRLDTTDVRAGRRSAR